MKTRYPQDKWLHIFTDGSQIDGYINAGAGIHCELFSCYMPLGQHSTAFDGEIEAIHTALHLLNLHQNKFERAVIFSDSKAAILSVGSTEAKDCQVLIRQLKAKHKQIALQWIPGHSQIAGIEYADTLLKPFYYQLMHIMLKNTELLKHSKITLQHVSGYVGTIFRELQSVLG